MKTLVLFAVLSFIGFGATAQDAGMMKKVTPNNGEKCTKDLSILSDPKADGVVEFFYATGKLKEKGGYLKGERHGVWIRYDENGNKIAEGIYDQGVKNGRWSIWDENGVKRFEFFYMNGQKYSVWSSWDDKGTLVASTNYDKL